MSDDTKRAILARRARFVAIALASAGVGCETPSRPGAQPLPLGETTRGDASTAATTTSAGTDASSSDAGAEPVPCLSMLPPEEDARVPPMVCLSVALPRDAGAPTPCLKVKPKSEE